MFNTPEFARDMKRGEEAQVDALLRAAFGGPEEAELVAKLRKARLIAGEQVMPMACPVSGCGKDKWWQCRKGRSRPLMLLPR